MNRAIHLAARETFAVDGLPACRGRRGFGGETVDGFKATHTLADVTCAVCQRTAEFKRAAALGLRDNDETWAQASAGVKGGAR